MIFNPSQSPPFNPDDIVKLVPRSGPRAVRAAKILEPHKIRFEMSNLVFQKQIMTLFSGHKLYFRYTWNAFESHLCMETKLSFGSKILRWPAGLGRLFLDAIASPSTYPYAEGFVFYWPLFFIGHLFKFQILFSWKIYSGGLLNWVTCVFLMFF